MTISINIEGIPKLKKFIKLKDKQVNLLIKKGMTKSAVFLQGEVKQSIAGRRAEGPFTIIPRKVTMGGAIRGPSVKDTVDTGRFLNSVGFQVNQFTASVFSKLPYAAMLEFGNGRIPGRKHFTNSADRSKLKIKQIIQNQINKI